MPSRIFVIVEPITNADETLTLVPSDERLKESDLLASGFTSEQLDEFMLDGSVLEITFGFPPPVPPTP